MEKFEREMDNALRLARAYVTIGLSGASFSRLLRIARQHGWDIEDIVAEARVLVDDETSK